MEFNLDFFDKRLLVIIVRLFIINEYVNKNIYFKGCKLVKLVFYGFNKNVGKSLCI